MSSNKNGTTKYNHGHSLQDLREYSVLTVMVSPLGIEAKFKLVKATQDLK